jgi:desulfoferrodoxin (superoxide reductase-like protein)
MDQGVDKDSICQTCGKNELVFAGPNTTEHFCQWLFSGENEGFFVVIRLVSLLTLDPVILGTFKIEKDVSLFLLSVVVIHG